VVEKHESQEHFERKRDSEDKVLVPPCVEAKFSKIQHLNVALDVMVADTNEPTKLRI
jgi:hypothetical protein